MKRQKGCRSMRLEQHEFTRTMKGNIMEAERELGKWCDKMNLKYQEIAATKSLDIKFQLSREGYDTFSPYYCSEVTLDVTSMDKVLDTHRIVIWECQRVFFGVPTKWNIPGSKIVGDLMDYPYENAALELEGHLEAYLQKM
jgi:hypothetical protein